MTTIEGNTHTGHHASVHVSHHDRDTKRTAWQDVRWGELLAELVGVTALVYFSGYVVLQADAGRATTTDVAVANGIIIGALFFLLGNYYVPQLNPAVTITSVVTRRQHWLHGLLYVVAQLVGSIIGAALLRGLVPDAILRTSRNASVLGFPHIPADADEGQVFFNELVFTLIAVLLFYTITNNTVSSTVRNVNNTTVVTEDRRVPSRVSSNVLFLALGGIYLLSIVAVAPTNVTALNPARVFGPSVVSNDWDDQWVFYIGPLVGALIAGLIYEYGVRRFERTRNVDRAHASHEERQRLVDNETGNNYGTLPVHAL